MNQIVDRAEAYLAAAGHHAHGTGRPAVVFDIDDTLLNTYDYTLAEQFGYSPATNEIWVDNAAFPAVFYMPQLVRFAASHGYSVFFITGRPQSQTAATIKDLTSAGYAAPQGGHLFLKPAVPPAYLHCAKAPSCTTIEYKSGTRKHISSEGYNIIADFGDQYSDLLGGDAGHQVKIPNPCTTSPDHPFVACGQPRRPGPARHDRLPGGRRFPGDRYIKVAARSTYLYRAHGQAGPVIDALLSRWRDLATVRQSRMLAQFHRPPAPARPLTTGRPKVGG
jgi:hypothetical protein